MSKTRTTFGFGAERRTVEVDDNEQQAYSALVDKFAEFMLFFVAVHRQHDLLGLGSGNPAGGVNANPDETTAPTAMGAAVDRQSRAPFIEMLVAIMHDLAVVPKKYKTLWRNNTLAHLIAELQYCTTIPTYKTFRAYRKPAPPSPPAKSRAPVAQSRHIAFDVFQGFRQSSYSTPSTSILSSPVRPRSCTDAQMRTQAHTHGHTNPSRVPLRRQGAFVGLAHLEEVIDALPERTWTTRQPGTSVDGNDLTGPPPPLIRDPPPTLPPATTTTGATTTTANATTADGGTASASRTQPSSQPPVVPLASTSKPSALPAAISTSPSTRPHDDATNPRRPLRRDFSSNSVPTLSLNGIPVKPHMTISISSEEEVVAIVSSHASSREEKKPRGRRTAAIATDVVPNSRKRRRDDLEDGEDGDGPSQASTSKSRAKSKSKSKDTSGGEHSGTISQPHHSSFDFASEGETSYRQNPTKKARGSAVKRGRGSTRAPRTAQSQTAKGKQSQMAIGEKDEDEIGATMTRPTVRSKTRASTRASTRTETPAEASQEQEGSQTRRRSTRLRSQPSAEKAKG